MKLIERLIEDEYTACPYCCSPVGIDQLGCCGESRAHFEPAYVYKGETVFKSEVEAIVRGPIIPWLAWEASCLVQRTIRTLARKLQKIIKTMKGV